MTILLEVAKELLGMFLADFRLTAAILALVLLVAVLVDGAGIDPVVAGALLLGGCLLILIEAVTRAARQRK